jgi:transposase-like protein
MAISVADPVSRDVRPTGRTVVYLLVDGLRRPRQTKSHDVVLCALGLDRDGTSRPLALRVVPREGEQAWIAMLRQLKSSGIGSDLLLISCDGHPALMRAIASVFPGTPVQISIAHRLLALGRMVDLKWRAACLAEARTIFSAPDLGGAVARFREWRTNWLKAGHRAVSSLESDLASCLMFYRFPQALWPKIRTVNLVERVFREARQAVFPPPEWPVRDGEERVAPEPVRRNGAVSTPVLALP